MPNERFTIDASELDDILDNGEFPEGLMTKIESAISEMKNYPGSENTIIQLIIVNDFEDEEEESEDEESDDKTTTETKDHND